MRKTTQWVLIGVTVLLAGAATTLYVQNQKTQEQLATSKMSESQVQDRYDRTIESIAEIQDSLDAIAVGPEGRAMFEGKTEAERRMSGPNRQDALDRIAALRTSIAQNKQRIQELEGNLKKSGVKVNSLNKLIAGLKRNVSEKEDEIAILNQRVEALNTQVTTLTTTVAEREDTLRTRDTQLEDRRRELATVYYVVGDKDHLKDTGVIETKGGVLGVGKTITPSRTPNLAVFSAIDTDQETVIRTPTAKARLISAQPAGSYALQLVDGHMELHILNPTEFRKVKQVVILSS
jgi:predicted RNase H-like nuclease (RuvC/YqgF family)